MRTPVEGDVTIEVTPLVEEDHVSGSLQNLIGIEDDRQIDARHTGRQTTDARIEELELVLLVDNLGPFRQRPRLEWNLPVRRVDNHRWSWRAAAPAAAT